MGRSRKEKRAAKEETEEAQAKTCWDKYRCSSQRFFLVAMLIAVIMLAADDLDLLRIEADVEEEEELLEEHARSATAEQAPRRVALVLVADNVGDTYIMSVLAAADSLRRVHSAARLVLIAGREACPADDDGALANEAAIRAEWRRRFDAPAPERRALARPLPVVDDFLLRAHTAHPRNLSVCDELLNARIVDYVFTFNVSAYQHWLRVPNSSLALAWIQPHYKFSAWALPPRLFDKLLLIDMDVYIADSFDDVYTYEPPAMVEWAPFVPNSGVMLFQPNARDYVGLLYELDATPYASGDQRKAAVHNASVDLNEISAEHFSQWPREHVSEPEPAGGFDGADQAVYVAYFSRTLPGPSTRSYRLNVLPSPFNVRAASLGGDRPDPLHYVEAYRGAELKLIHMTVAKPWRGLYCPPFPHNLVAGTWKHVAQPICHFYVAAQRTLQRTPAFRCEHCRHGRDDPIRRVQTCARACEDYVNHPPIAANTTSSKR